MEPTSDIYKDYHEWLCSKVVDERHENYKILLDRLDGLWFSYTVPNDDNRARDGIDLRYEYCDRNYIPYEMVDDELNDPCTVLEMLIGLAERWENQLMWDPDYGDRTHIWFWKMIDNLGLGEETDTIWDENSEEKVVEYVGKFVHRRYSRDGFGGLFPLKHPKNDQRKVEIWYQLQYWLQENFDF